MVERSLKIRIIAVYYGSFPEYFPMWLKSCAMTPSIDFLIVTDSSDGAYSLPSNVQVLTMDFCRLKELAKEKIGMELTLDTPYKLCDYKPAYGLIFEDYLIGYDYWGHCDIDLVWGDLSHFFEEYHLEQYDKFLDRGHLSLYRNLPDMNRLFMCETETSSYKNVFSTNQSCFFDECSMVEIAKNQNKRVFEKCIYADMNLFYKHFCHAAHRDRPKNHRMQVFAWEDGHIFQYHVKNGVVCKKEWIYLHFQKRNMPILERALLHEHRFALTSNGFASLPESVSASDIRRLNPHGTWAENLNRREYVYCKKDNLHGREFRQYLVLRTKSVICNSRIWQRFCKTVWISMNNLLGDNK